MNDITIQQLKEKMDAGEDIKLIDVREPYENQEFNIGGDLIPLGSLPEAIEDLEAFKDQEVIVYCRTGNRSGMAKEFLKQAGFKNVRNLLGGVSYWAEVYGT